MHTLDQTLVLKVMDLAFRLTNRAMEVFIVEYKEKVEAMLQGPSEIIDLNIGGTHQITTSRRTLMSVPDSTLAAMFSGRH